MKQTKKNISIFVLLFFFIFVTTSLALAQEMPVPSEEQLKILLNTLTFDRNLKKRQGERLTIGIVYQGSYRNSLQAKDDLIEALKSVPIREIFSHSLHIVPIDLYLIGLEEAVTSQDVDVLYVAPLKAYDIRKISQLSRQERVITFSGVPEYSEQGIAVTVGKKGDKAQIIINLSAAKAEGADFSSQLLKLAKIVE